MTTPDSNTPYPHDDSLPWPVVVLLLIIVFLVGGFFVWDEEQTKTKRAQEVEVSKASWDKFVVDYECKLSVVDQVNGQTTYICRDGVTYIKK